MNKVQPIRTNVNAVAESIAESLGVLETVVPLTGPARDAYVELITLVSVAIRLMERTPVGKVREAVRDTELAAHFRIDDLAKEQKDAFQRKATLQGLSLSEARFDKPHAGSLTGDY